MDICDWIAYGSAFGTLFLAAICVILFREEIIDRCLQKLDGLCRVYRRARHIVRGVVKAFRDDHTEHKERRRAFKIMKLQRRQILDAARLRELQKDRK